MMLGTSHEMCKSFGIGVENDILEGPTVGSCEPCALVGEPRMMGPNGEVKLGGGV